MLSLAILMTALLFGGMVLYSFGFAAFLFTALPTDVAGPTIRRAFPMFYIFVLSTAAVAVSGDHTSPYRACGLRANSLHGGLVAWRFYPAKTSSPIPVRLHWSL